MKRSMTRLLVPILGVAAVLSGCGNSSPNYSLFNNVPSQSLVTVQDAVQKSAIPNLAFPTRFPYPITEANIAKGQASHRVTIFFGDSNHVVQLNATQTAKNAAVTVSLPNAINVKLADGTQAEYGENETSSQLAWDKNGVLYILASSNNNNRADLTQQQLIAVANSFK